MKRVLAGFEFEKSVNDGPSFVFVFFLLLILVPQLYLPVSC